MNIFGILTGNNEGVCSERPCHQQTSPCPQGTQTQREACGWAGNVDTAHSHAQSSTRMADDTPGRCLILSHEEGLRGFSISSLPSGGGFWNVTSDVFPANGDEAGCEFQIWNFLTGEGGASGPGEGVSWRPSEGLGDTRTGQRSAQPPAPSWDTSRLTPERPTIHYKQ